jgi:hypothetical protein
MIPDLFLMTSYSNIPATLSKNTLYDRAIDLTILTDLSITFMNHINTLSIQDLHSTLEQLVELA